MAIVVVIRLLVGLLSVSESFRPEAEASDSKPADNRCTHIAFPKGARITARGSGENKYCGSDIGSFLALEENQLLHLPCQPGNMRATVTVSDGRKRSRGAIFSREEVCTVEKGYITTADKAKILTDALINTLVPYDDTYCNSEHYFRYLARGIVGDVSDNKVTETCPIFMPIPRKIVKPLESSRFRLRGMNVEYSWPTAQGTERKVLSVETVNREVPVTFPDEMDEENGRGGKHGNHAGVWVPKDLSVYVDGDGFRRETPSKGGFASKSGSPPRRGSPRKGGSPSKGGSPLKGGSSPKGESPSMGKPFPRSESEVIGSDVSEGYVSDGYVSDSVASDVSNNSDGSPKPRKKGWRKRAKKALTRISRSFN